MRKFLPAIGLTLALSSPALAVTIDESALAGGDFGQTFPVPTDDIGTLDIGTNTVTGSIAVSCAAAGPCSGGSDEVDGFTFTVATGQEIYGATISTAGTGTAPDPTYAVLLDGLGTFIFEFYDLNSGGAFLGGTVLEAGTYSFFVGSGLASGAGDYTATWVATALVRDANRFEPSVVPLPAGLPLIATALGALGLTARRKRKG